MAQAMVVMELNRINSLKTKNVGTQTGQNSEFCVALSQNKIARLYYSEAYKDVVLSFNINNAKSFIITRSMWKILRNHLFKIDNELNQ